MALPLAVLAPLILGGGIAAKEVGNKLEAARKRKFAVETTPAQLKAMLIAQDEAKQQIALQQQQAPTGAQKATPVPQAGAPQAEEPVAPAPEEMSLEGSGLTTGEVTDLPALPMRDLAASAPYAIQGWSVDSQTGKVNYQIKKDESALGAQFHQMFRNSLERLQQTNPGMPPLEMDSRALTDAIHRSGMLPPKQILDMLDPAHRVELSEQIYWSAVNRMRNNPDVRRGIALMARQDGKEMTSQAIDAAAIHYILRAVTNDMGGFVPDDVKEQIFNMEGPPISDERMQVAFQLFGITQPNQMTQAMLEKVNSVLKQDQLSQKYDEKLMQGLASEEALQIIEQRETGVKGAGPVAREVRERATLAETAPITPKVRAEAGVPVDMKTYLDIVKAGKRLMTKQDQDNVDRIESIVLVMGQLQKNADKIFTSEADFLSRAKHGAILKYERKIGSDLGIAVENYQDQRETVVRLLLELVGESGGRFTDKDMQQIQKAIPEIEGLIGDFIEIMPEAKKVAQNKFANMDALLQRKLSFIKAPQMVTIRPEKPKFKITKDGKVEKK
jgi:hypothetical protein